MNNAKVEVKNVSYNAALQSFEAIVVFYTSSGSVRVPASYATSLGTDFEDATRGLVDDARRNRSVARGLQSRVSYPAPHVISRQSATRHIEPRRNPSGFLSMFRRAS